MGNRKYVILLYSDIDKVDFNEVLETSAETVRVSIDGTLTFVKYDGEMPASISNIPSVSQEYNRDEFLTILASSEWTSYAEEV